MCKIQKGSLITVKKTGAKGTVQQLLPNPYVPAWLSSPNYLVYIEGGFSPEVFTKKEIKQWEEKR